MVACDTLVAADEMGVLGAACVGGRWLEEQGGGARSREEERSGEASERGGDRVSGRRRGLE